MDERTLIIPDAVWIFIFIIVAVMAIVAWSKTDKGRKWFL